MSGNKLRVIKDYEKLPKEIQEQIKLTYPNGFSQHLITFTDKDGKLVSALPFETEDKYYLVRMTKQEALDIVFADDDFDEDGILKDAVKEEFSDKYAELDYLNEVLGNSEDDFDDDGYDDDDLDEDFDDDVEDVDNIDDIDDEDL
ncbi:MAG: hypothetical protein SNJ71_01705 [Bacteroidales bacterium]